MIPVFVVNMKQHADRRAAIKAHLLNLMIDFEIFEAVDGKDITADEQNRIIAPNTRIPLGHVGCYLSHINIYRYMVEEKIRVALILEDDARVHPRVAELLRFLDQSQPNFDYCFLDSENFNNSGPVFYDKDSQVTVGPGIVAHKLSEGPSTMHAYLITLPAAERRIEHAFPISRPIDVYDQLPYEISFYSIVSPKLAWLSEYGMTSATYERGQEGPLAFRALKKSIWYYHVRDFISMTWLDRYRDVRNAQQRGRLPSTGRWRRLPQGKVIIVD
jgi:glycosyl transferase family 25